MRQPSANVLITGVPILLAALAGPALPATAALPKVFIETEVAPSDPYVQAAARVTVRVYSARALYHADLDLPGNSDVLVRQVGADDRGSVRRDGRSYDVLTRQYLVFAQHSGKLSLPGAVLSAQILTSAGRSDRFYNPGGPGGGSPYGYGAMIAVEPLQLRGDAIALRVRPRPAAAVSSYWMPARQVTLASAWHPGTAQAHVGDALTLTLTVQAEGLTAEQLPDLSTLLAMPQGLKAYPDEPKLDNAAEGDTLIGRREQSIALIAGEPGHFTLPALQLRWWDTVHDVAQTVMVPARTLAVLPSQAAPLPGAAGAPPAGAAEADARAASGAFSRRDPWLWASLALALVWIATLAAWRVSARWKRAQRALPPPRSSPGAPRARAAFLEACREDDPRAARRHLLAWADAERFASPPAGLNGMAKQIGEPEIGRLLRELDRACYAGGAWRGDALARALPELPVPAGRAKGRKSPLEPLYR